MQKSIITYEKVCHGGGTYQAEGAAVIEVAFEIKGEKIQPDNMADALDSLFLKHIKEQINISIASISCKKHGEKASVIVKGSSLDSLEYEVSGCCKDFASKIKKRLNRLK